MPGSSVTIDISLLATLLIKLDLPVFGLPIIATTNPDRIFSPIDPSLIKLLISIIMFSICSFIFLLNFLAILHRKNL